MREGALSLSPLHWLHLRKWVSAWREFSSRPNQILLEGEKRSSLLDVLKLWGVGRVVFVLTSSAWLVQGHQQEQAKWGDSERVKTTVWGCQLISEEKRKGRRWREGEREEQDRERRTEGGREGERQREKRERTSNLQGWWCGSMLQGRLCANPSRTLSGQAQMLQGRRNSCSFTLQGRRCLCSPLRCRDGAAPTTPTFLPPSLTSAVDRRRGSSSCGCKAGAATPASRCKDSATLTLTPHCRDGAPPTTPPTPPSLPYICG